MRTGNWFFLFVCCAIWVCKPSLINLIYVSFSTAASEYSLSLNTPSLFWIIFPCGDIRLYFSSWLLTLTVGISIMFQKGKLNDQPSQGREFSSKFCRDWRCNKNVGKSSANSVAVIKTQYVWEICVDREDKLWKWMCGEGEKEEWRYECDMPAGNVMKNVGGIGNFNCRVKKKKEYQTLKQSLCWGNCRCDLPWEIICV